MSAAAMRFMFLACEYHLPKLSLFPSRKSISVSSFCLMVNLREGGAMSCHVDVCLSTCSMILITKMVV